MAAEPELDLDEEKWGAPATSAEVAQGLLECRHAMIALYGAVIAAAQNDEARMKDRLGKFLAADGNLKKLIDNIGGLAGRDR